MTCTIPQSDREDFNVLCDLFRGFFAVPKVCARDLANSLLYATLMSEGEAPGLLVLFILILSFFS